MKKKFSSMWRVTIALVMVLSLNLVMATPVSAGAVGTPTVTLSTYEALATDVQHTISFDIGVSLEVGEEIIITFDSLYATPTSWADGDVTVDGVSVLGTSVITSGDVVTITLPATVSTIDNPVVVVFTSAANIPNPVAGTTYTISVQTTVEDVATSSSYTILALPEVTGVKPAAGNVGDTMWVEVTGTGFTGNTTVATTALNFGTGISVVSGSYHWVDATSLDVQITINAAGAARYVIPTTPAGEGTNTAADFDPNAADTTQVDVWDKYTPTEDLAADDWDGDTLVMSAAVQTSIGSAITAASTGDTLIVHAATYVENPDIDKEITLKSLSGKATTIIDASGQFWTGINIRANNVTVDGFTVADSSGDGIRIAAGTVGATVQNNTINAELTGVLAYADVDDALIKNNVISDSGLGIWMVEGAQHSEISGNTITDSGGVRPTAILLEGGNGASEDATHSIIIKENIITGNINVGIYLQRNTNPSYFDDIVIEGNTISGAKPYGIFTNWDLAITGLVITKNDITGSWEDGIRIHSWEDGGTSVINYNNIYLNGLYGLSSGGIKNKTSQVAVRTVDAKYNWWGENGGPDAIISDTWAPTAGTALGNGDRISKDVLYDPWLSTVQATAVSEGVAYHGSTYPLEEGWNTFSVPLALNDSADTLDDIVALGDFLVISGADQNYDGGFYYDGTLWLSITGTYEFKPGSAVYVKMLADAEFPVLYSGVFSVPSVSLPAGWNLVGSMFGIDKGTGGDDYGIAPWNDGDGDGDKEVDVALASLGTSATVVISPSMPGQTAAWATTVGGTSQNMIVGEGYWVFLTAPATLAGFEVTPIYKIFLP